MQLTTTHGSASLKRGWAEFLSFYSVKHGDLIVFQNEIGTFSNEFDVFIFCKTAMEVEFPVRPWSHSSNLQVEIISDDREGFLEIFEQGSYTPATILKCKLQVHVRTLAHSLLLYRVCNSSSSDSGLRLTRRLATTMRTSMTQHADKICS